MSTHEQAAQRNWRTYHPVTGEDRLAMDALRSATGSSKGLMQGTEARAAFDSIMEGVMAPEAVAFENAAIGGISGSWCRPESARPGQAILHVHGGWFNWGSARAFRHLVGHIAARAGVAAFIPDYRLAPEHPYPAAPDDVELCYLGLLEKGYTSVAVTGDSAGGNLALVLAASIAANKVSVSAQALRAVVALSPITDLTQSGASWHTQADADPYFLKSQAAGMIRSYLNGSEAATGAASPLFADLAGLPPSQVHVGEDEVLLDDSVRFAERAYTAGTDIHLHIWQGMVHGFLGNIGRLQAASIALNIIGPFLTEQLNSSLG